MALLVSIIELLLERLNVNSRNSSIPPSQDPYRQSTRRPTGGKVRRKPGGQPGHEGETLALIPNPDHVEKLQIDRRTLPKGHRYKRVRDDVRQVVDIQITRKVTEYRAEVLEDERGKQYRAEFPAEVTRPVQYGASVRAMAVYLSTYQLLPCNRIQDFFRDQVGIEISGGSICNFRQEAFYLLEGFEENARRHLQQAIIAHFDETGFRIGGKRLWLHSASSDKWTLYGAHANRGAAGMAALGVLPYFTGFACHDHWHPYFTFKNCVHVLCNAHHARELQGVIENEGHTWATEMKMLLERIHTAVRRAGGVLSSRAQATYRKKYRAIIAAAENECPRNETKRHRRGRAPQSKARNLLDRLREHEDETLRFITHPLIPFTNNLAERDIRMMKLQQKISGCFRSFDGARAFCRVRSYISTAIKQGISATDALSSLFQGSPPAFARESAE